MKNLPCTCGHSRNGHVHASRPRSHAGMCIIYIYVDGWSQGKCPCTKYRPTKTKGTPMINKDGCYHTEETCKGEYCCFHNPSDHKMNKWPMNIRLDRGGMTERMCKHGIGHPDPDSLNWIAREATKYDDIPDSGVHGCDGCCRENAEPPTNTWTTAKFKVEKKTTTLVSQILNNFKRSILGNIVLLGTTLILYYFAYLLLHN